MSAVTAKASSDQLLVPRTPLIGRTQEVIAACHQLRNQDVGLLTLVGPGGVGKTRLAVAIADVLQSEFREGVRYVQLASLDDPSLVPSTIAQALNVREHPDQPVIEGLQFALRTQQLLLVLDNFEHLTIASRDLAVLLDSCRELKLLVTSRTSLHLRAEHVFPVRPLTLPVMSQLSDLEVLASTDAVSLFTERARATLPEFVLTDKNAAIVAAICSRLDGLPLAIELAAARVRLLSPQMLLDRLSHRLALLKSSTPDAMPRQRTLRNTIAWSFDLLTPEQQIVARRLAVFVGGWTLDAATAIVPADGEDLDVLDSLATLMDHHLIIRSDEPYETRFSMLETVMEFLSEELALNGDRPAVQHRHAEWFRTFAEAIEQRQEFLAPANFHEIAPDLPNLRAALDWLVRDGDGSGFARLASTLGWFWFHRAFYAEGRDRLMQALAFSATSSLITRAKILFGAAAFTHVHGENIQALQYIDECIAIARNEQEPRVLGLALIARGQIRIELQGFEEATADINEGAELGQTSGDLFLRATALEHLALTSYSFGNYAQCTTYAAQAVALGREMQYESTTLASSLEILSLAKATQREYPEALALLRQTIEMCQRIDQPHLLAMAAVVLAWTAEKFGQPERATFLLGWADGLCERTNSVLLMPEREIHQAGISSLRMRLGDDLLSTILADGRRKSLEDIVIIATETMDGLLVDPAQSTETKHADTSRLTKRELEVLRLIAEGQPDREIATTLFISTRTVTSHVTNILNKLGVNSRAAAAAYAVRHNLV